MLTNLFQRYYLWTFLVLSGLLGLALANLTTTAISLESASAPITTPDLEAKTQKPAVRKSLNSYQTIVANNIFNAELRNRPAVALAESAGTARSASSNWTLIGTVSGENYSLATLRDKSGTTTYALDDELPDGAILSAIERNKVELRYRSGRVVTLEVDENGLKPVSKTRNKDRSLPGTEMPITSLGDNRWQIPGPVIEDARANMATLMKQARAVPYLKDGQTAGFQIKMIKSGSLMNRIGLMRGDIIQRINGLELNSPEKALQIFGQLRQAKQITIDLERKGKPMTFAYEIR